MWTEYNGTPPGPRGRMEDQDRPLLLMFASDDCGFSTELESEFETPEVATALEHFRCQRTEARGSVRLPNGWKHAAASHPQSLLFTPGNDLLDVIRGWRPPDELAFELNRISSGHETIPAILAALQESPGDTKLRWLLIRKLSVFPRRALLHSLLLRRHSIRGDPTGLKLQRMWRTLMRVYKRRTPTPAAWDYSPVAKLLQDEQNEFVLFEGWRILASGYLSVGQEREAQRAFERALEFCPREWENLLRSRLESVNKALAS